MPIIEKDVLYCGSWHLPGDLEWTCDGQTIREAAANGNRMLRAGNTAPPLCWDHDLTAFPMPVPALLSALSTRPGGVERYAANVSKNTFGFAEGFRVGTEKGEPVLYAKCNIPRPRDAGQFQITRYVSPRVDYDFKDWNKRFWPGSVVTHIASTSMPIQMGQKAVMLGTPAPLGGRNTSRSFVMLSFEGSKMAEEKPKGGEGGGGSDLVKRLSAALTRWGVTIPESVTTPDELVLSLESIGANVAPGDGGGGGLLDDDDEEELEDASGASTSVSPAMLSAMPKSVQLTLTATGKEYKERLQRMVNFIEKKQPRNMTPARYVAMRKAVADADTSVMLSMHGGARAKNPMLNEIVVMAQTLGFKGKAANLSGTITPGKDTDEVPTPKIQRTGTLSASAEAVERERLRVGGKPKEGATKA